MMHQSIPVIDNDGCERHYSIEYADACDRLNVKPVKCQHCADLERENRRLRMRYELAVGTVTCWQWWSDNVGDFIEFEPRNIGFLLKHYRGVGIIRLGDGTPEQEQHDER